MGIDAGFDMVPRLSRGILDKHNWSTFIKEVREHYKDDQQVEIKPKYLIFKAGEHPTLPFEGHKFLRFSSKVSGSNANVESYISTVAIMAKVHFGSRIRLWNEACDQYGIYGWPEVHESKRSYEQPDEEELPSPIAGLVFGTNPVQESGLLSYDVQQVSGKGRGLVARFDIPMGTRILIEAPLLKIENRDKELLNPMVATILKTLSREKQRQFLSLHNNFPGKFALSGIVKTNALPCGSGARIGGVYPTISLINHSCLPNAHNNWNADSEQETIHAIGHISKGEEITICYSRGGSASARQTELKQAFGFDCSCSLCSMSLEEVRESDTRRSRIQQLDDSIGDPFRMIRYPAACLADCASLLRLLKEEYGDNGGASYARAYYDAFQISVAHGDQARGAAFAERAYKARVICEGEDSPITRRMEELMRDPSMHPSFAACSRRWRSKREDMMRAVDGFNLEKWLWRE